MEKNSSILASSLRKCYRSKEVLKDVSLSVPKGSIYALLGSNGAGKTTTIRILTAQLQADSGSLLIEGLDPKEHLKQIQEQISVTGQFSAVDESLTGKENLLFMAQLRKLPDPEEKTEELLRYFALSHAANRRAASYSGGMKRKLDIAMSLIGNPKVIFLDEPTTALDPQSRRNMWKLILELKQSGITIFLTTQYLEEAEQLADFIGILDQGRIIAEGTPLQLKKYLPQGAVSFTFENEESFQKAKLLTKEYAPSVLPEEQKITLFTDNKADTLAYLFHQFYEQHIPIHDFSEVTPTLEDVFLSIITERKETIHDQSNTNV